MSTTEVPVNEINNQEWLDKNINTLRTSRQCAERLFQQVVPRFKEQLLKFFETRPEKFHFEGREGFGVSCDNDPDKQLVRVITCVESGKNMITDEVIIKKWVRTFTYVELLAL